MNSNDVVNEFKYSLSLLAQPQVVAVLLAIAVVILLAALLG